MKLTTTFSLIILILALACTRKITNLVVADSFPNVLIDDDEIQGRGPSEPSITINPGNKDQLVVGTILDRIFVSEDGGSSWIQDRLTSPYGVYGDPVLACSADGIFYYAHLSDPTGKGYQDARWLDRIVIQKSKDGARTWNDGTFPEIGHPKDQDKHWLVVDQSTGDLFITWTEFDKYGSPSASDNSRILFSSSQDEAETWTKPIQINQRAGDCRDDDNTVEGAVPAIGVDGEVYVAWSGHENIYFDVSLDRGKSWQDKDRIVARQPGGWKIDIPGIYRCNGMPVTGVDHSQGSFRGRIYVNWSDQSNGAKDTDVWISSSDDQGLSWSKPLRVNDDPEGRHQFFSWMDIDPVTGYVYIVFYDRRNYDDNRTDFYLAYSVDGGKTFVNKKISKSPFIPTSSVFFGDYSNVVAYDGRVRPVWTRADKTKLSLWTALIDMK
jgi:hypothetical protein